MSEKNKISKPTGGHMSVYNKPEETLRAEEVEFFVANPVSPTVTKFCGHNLVRLVEAILKAQGYVTTKSEPGKDNGIDILAGSGAWLKLHPNFFKRDNLQ